MAVRCGSSEPRESRLASSLFRSSKSTRKGTNRELLEGAISPEPRDVASSRIIKTSASIVITLVRAGTTLRENNLIVISRLKL
jgi:hypothetical protein